MKNYAILTPKIQDTSSYHCANVNVQNYTVTIDSVGGIHTPVGYIWGYGKNYGFYVNFYGGDDSRVVFEHECQMFGTLNVNTVEVNASITLWSPYNKGSNIQNCIEDNSNGYVEIEVRTFGEASRLCIQNADSKDEWGATRFNIATDNNVMDSDNNRMDSLVTIKNLSASGISIYMHSSDLERTDIRVESGLSDESVQIIVKDYAYLSGSSESDAALGVANGTKLLYAPDLKVNSNISARYEKDLHKITGEMSSQCSSSRTYLGTYKDANGYLCVGEVPEFSLEKYDIALSENESTMIKVIAKSSSASEVEWSSSGNISVSGDLSQVTIQSTGAFTGSEMISYSAKDKNGNSLITGWIYVKEKSTASSEEEKTDYITTYNGVNYAAVYDYNYYINKYADLKKAFGTDDVAALAHFVNYGMKEGRQASSEFNVNTYRSRYADLQNIFGSNLKSYYLHYISYGKREGRSAK